MRFVATLLLVGIAGNASSFDILGLHSIRSSFSLVDLLALGLGILSHGTPWLALYAVGSLGTLGRLKCWLTTDMFSVALLGLSVVGVSTLGAGPFSFLLLSTDLVRGLGLGALIDFCTVQYTLFGVRGEIDGFRLVSLGLIGRGLCPVCVLYCALRSYLDGCLVGDRPRVLGCIGPGPLGHGIVQLGTLVLSIAEVHVHLGHAIEHFCGATGRGCTWASSTSALALVFLATLLPVASNAFGLRYRTISLPCF